MAGISGVRAGVAAVVAVFVPVLIGAAVGSATADKPKPAEVAVDAHLTANDVVGDGDGSARPIRILAAGPPPEKAARLANKEGKNAVKAMPTPGKCRDAPRFATRASTDGHQRKWCITLTGLRSGSETEGVLTGEATKVTLGASLKQRLLIGPLVAGVLGLLGGILAILAVPFVRAVSGRSELDGLLSDNDVRVIEERVEGLRGWVTQAKAAGKGDSDLLSPVERVMRYGPASARDARRQLQRLLDASTISPTQPVRQSAAVEAQKSSHAVGDFLKSDGSWVEEHPAVSCSKLFRQLSGAAIHLELAEERINHLNPTSRPALQSDYVAAAEFFARAQADDLDDLVKQIGDLHKKIDAAGGTHVAKAAGEGSPALTWIEPPSVSRTFARNLRIGVVTISVLFALVSLYFAIYLPSPTFGTASDYYKLIAAAAASGAGATIVSVLDWRATES